MMKRSMFGVAFAALLSSTALAENVVVDFKVKADMPSLRDKKALDTFKVSIADGQVKTNFDLQCQGGSKGLIFRTDEACTVTGTGAVINPANKMELQRAKYSGGFTVKADGYTDGRTIAVNYLTLGNVPASSDAFGGTLILKPDAPSSGAMAFGESVIAGLKKKAGADGGLTVNTATDTIEFSNFTTPSSGWPSDKGCSWRGSGVYTYQNSTWFLKLDGDCNGKKYNLTGNMPWVDLDNGDARYDLTLALPSAAMSTDQALFTDAAAGDLFATADGINGSIVMKLGSPVTVKVEGQDEEVPSSIDASGTLSGHNIPVEVVRSLSTVLGVLARTFFGA